MPLGVADLLDLKMRLYETLREESLQAMAQRNTVLALGTAAIGALFSAAVYGLTASNRSPELAFVIFVLILPVLSCLLAAMWLGEAGRMSRAGGFMRGIEDEVNELLRSQLSHDLPGVDVGRTLYWENWLREPSNPPPSRAPVLIQAVANATEWLLANGSPVLTNPRTNQSGYPYLSVGVFFGGVALLSTFFGLVLAGHEWHGYGRRQPVAIGVCILMCLFTLIVFFNLLHRAMRLR